MDLHTAVIAGRLVVLIGQLSRLPVYASDTPGQQTSFLLQFKSKVSARFVGKFIIVVSVSAYRFLSLDLNPTDGSDPPNHQIPLPHPPPP